MELFKELGDGFITKASRILADTNMGLSGSEIVDYCTAYANDYNVILPYCEYPFTVTVSKRDALHDNLMQFTSEQKAIIIKDLCDIPKLKKNDEVKLIKKELIRDYGYLIPGMITNPVHEAFELLKDYPESQILFKSALDKYSNRIYDRNALDDTRLSLELLLKQLFTNNAPLEKQKESMGKYLKTNGMTGEIRNMIIKTFDDYILFQNNHVKHNDSFSEHEISFVIEYTSSIIKLLLSTNNAQLHSAV